MKTNSNSKFLMTFLAISLLGCESESTDTQTNTNTSNRFQAVTITEEIYIEDGTTRLNWVNGLEPQSSKAQTGCNPLPAGMAANDVIDQAKDFCDMLNFANFSDWRIATSSELQNYTVDIQAEGITPFYQNPSCPRVIAIDVINSIETVVTINTHNSSPIGAINNWNARNAGVRCVR